MSGVGFISILSGVATAASAVMSIVGGNQAAEGHMAAARAQAQANEYNAKVQERNMVIADQNRKAAVRQAGVDAEDKRRENRRTLAALRSAYGASGLEMAGSPLDVLADSATELELDAQRTEYEGQARNREGAIQMLGMQEDATLQRMEGRNALIAGSARASAARMNGITGAIGTVGGALQRMG